MTTTFFRVFGYAFKSFTRNIWLSLITISVLVLALISANTLVIFRLIAEQAIVSVEDKVDVSVYFKPEVSAGDVNNVKSALDRLEAVKEVRYISPDQALADFKERHKNDPEILASLEEVQGNPLGSSLIVKSRDLSGYTDILRELERPEFAGFIHDKNFDDHETVINRIREISERVQKIAIVVTLVFSVIAVIVIFNTIRIAVYTQRQEIEIKKLVGATNWFIKTPYLIESFIASLLAMALLLAILYPTLGAVDPYLYNFFEGSNFSVFSYFNRNFLSVFGLEFLSVLVLTVVSSSIAVGRYLKA